MVPPSTPLLLRAKHTTVHHTGTRGPEYITEFGSCFVFRKTYVSTIFREEQVGEEEELGSPQELSDSGHLYSSYFTTLDGFTTDN